MRKIVDLTTKLSLNKRMGRWSYMETMLMSACEASLKPLDIDCIDFYYQYHIETRVPIEVKVRQFSFVFINLVILSLEY